MGVFLVSKMQIGFFSPFRFILLLEKLREIFLSHSLPTDSDSCITVIDQHSNKRYKKTLSKHCSHIALLDTNHFG